MSNEVQQSQQNPGANAQIVYYLYLASILLGFTSIVGVVMAYLGKEKAPDWVQTHYQYQIRTFWISFGVGILGIILSAVVIGLFILLALFIWFIIRCVKGLMLANDQEAHPDPTTWWI